MTRAAPQPGCYELTFRGIYPIGEPAEVALEDYTRELLRAGGAEAMRADDDPAMVRGVHVCGLGASVGHTQVTDIEDFARSLAVSGGSGGLGWS